MQLRLEYRINRHFSLEAEGGQNRKAADALFNYEWYFPVSDQGNKCRLTFG